LFRIFNKNLFPFPDKTHALFPISGQSLAKGAEQGYILTGLLNELSEQRRMMKNDCKSNDSKKQQEDGAHA
jgi:hypothetical protein